MNSTSRLDAYHFYEQEWDSYEQLRDSFEWEVPDRFNSAEYICDRWASDSSRVALYDFAADGTERTFTFQELRDVTDRLANYLQARGIGRGDSVGVNAPQKSETLIAHIAIWKLGAVSVPLSTLFGTEAVRYRLDDADAKACIVDASNAETVREVTEDVENLGDVLVIDDEGATEGGFWDAIEGSSPGFDTVDTHAEDDAIVIYTSGTTGDPKGVRHAHRVLLGNLPMFVTTVCNMEMSADDVFWTPSEWAWVATLYDILFPGLFFGKPVVAYEADGGFDPATAFSIVEKYDVTHYFAPPTALRMMMQVEDAADVYEVDDVRVVSSGGESLGQSVVEWTTECFDGATVHEGYGQTEANMIVGDCTALTEFREGKIGLPAPGHEIAIVDPETADRTVDRGEIGEIAIRYESDPVCFKEYLNKPAATDAKVENGWLLTEDLGRMDEDDYITFHSRKDTVIISSGYKIGPVEIEEALGSHAAVADAGVIGVPDDERGEVPKAFVELMEGSVPTTELKDELRQYVRNRLAEYEYPRKIEFIDQLPKTTTGKVRRLDLEAREE